MFISARWRGLGDCVKEEKKEDDHKEIGGGDEVAGAQQFLQFSAHPIVCWKNAPVQDLWENCPTTKEAESRLL